MLGLPWVALQSTMFTVSARAARTYAGRVSLALRTGDARAGVALGEHAAAVMSRACLVNRLVTATACLWP